MLPEKWEMWVLNFVLNERLSSKMASAFLEELGGTEADVDQSAASIVVAPPPNPAQGTTVYLVVVTDPEVGSIHLVSTSSTGPDEVRNLGGFRQRVAWEMPAGAQEAVELFGFPGEIDITASTSPLRCPPAPERVADAIGRRVCGAG